MKKIMEVYNTEKLPNMFFLNKTVIDLKLLYTTHTRNIYNKFLTLFFTVL
jgi:hypothetical protein